jgi:hypothetical protein
MNEHITLMSYYFYLMTLRTLYQWIALGNASHFVRQIMYDNWTICFSFTLSYVYGHPVQNQKFCLAEYP